MAFLTGTSADNCIVRKKNQERHNFNGLRTASSLSIPTVDILGLSSFIK